jgi:hypothetical protein
VALRWLLLGLPIARAPCGCWLVSESGKTGLSRSSSAHRCLGVARGTMNWHGGNNVSSSVLAKGESDPWVIGGVYLQVQVSKWAQSNILITITIGIEIEIEKVLWCGQGSGDQLGHLGVDRGKEIERGVIRANYYSHIFNIQGRAVEN